MRLDEPNIVRAPGIGRQLVPQLRNPGDDVFASIFGFRKPLVAVTIGGLNFDTQTFDMRGGFCSNPGPGHHMPTIESADAKISSGSAFINKCSIKVCGAFLDRG